MTKDDPHGNITASEAPQDTSPEEEGLTNEFEIIQEVVTDAGDATESENPRDTLSDDELDDHIEQLRSVVRARERAVSSED